MAKESKHIIVLPINVTQTWKIINKAALSHLPHLNPEALSSLEENISNRDLSRNSLSPNDKGSTQ